MESHATKNFLLEQKRLEKTIVRCPWCKNNVSLAAPYCPTCGCSKARIAMNPTIVEGDIDISSNSTVVCSSCSSIINAMSSVCPRCGSKLIKGTGNAANAKDNKYGKSLVGKTICHEVLGEGIISKVTSDRIFIKIQGKEYQLAPLEFIKYVSSTDSDCLNYVRKAFDIDIDEKNFELSSSLLDDEVDEDEEYDEDEMQKYTIDDANKDRLTMERSFHGESFISEL